MMENKNSLENLRQAINLTFFIAIYIDFVILNILDYEKGDNFYLFYYLSVATLITAFSIFLNKDKYKDSRLIHYLSKAFKITHIKYKFLSLLVFLVIPLVYISFDNL